MGLLYENLRFLRARLAGEIDFYKGMAKKIKSKGQSILEVACGTGRVGMRLAKEGVRVVGLDLSAGMLKEAARKSEGMTNIRWVKGDMCSFNLGETFGLAMITGHAFHNLNTAAEQHPPRKHPSPPASGWPASYL